MLWCTAVVWIAMIYRTASPMRLAAWMCCHSCWVFLYACVQTGLCFSVLCLSKNLKEFQDVFESIIGVSHDDVMTRVVWMLFTNDMTSLIHDPSNPLDCDDGVERPWDTFSLTRPTHLQTRLCLCVVFVCCHGVNANVNPFESPDDKRAMMHVTCGKIWAIFWIAMIRLVSNVFWMMLSWRMWCVTWKYDICLWSYMIRAIPWIAMME